MAHRALIARSRSQIEMRFEMIGEAVEDIVDQGLVGEIARARAPSSVEPARALAVVGEEAVHIGARSPGRPPRRRRPRAVVESREGPRARPGPSVSPICIS